MHFSIILLLSQCVWLIEVIMTVKGAGNIYWDDTSPRFDPTFHLFYVRFFCSVNLTRYGAIGIVSYDPISYFMCV